MKLTIKQIQNLKPNPERDYKVSDGVGLYIFISKAGGKHWRFKYRYLGKEKVFTIGEYPYISLADARDKRFELKKMLENGIDPNTYKRELRNEALTEAENTFERVAREWHEQRKAGWTKGYAHDVIRRLERDAFPAFGKRPITSITTRDIITLLQDMENRGVGELARRLKQTVSEVFRFAAIHEFVKVNPVANFQSRDVLKKVEKNHFATIEPGEIPAFLKALNENKACLRPLTRLAIKMLMLTFVRTNELINARWDEFDFDHNQWLIPPERMKMRKVHVVPLSRQVVAILREIQSFSRHKEYVFPSHCNPRKFMSNNTILQALTGLGYKGKMTGHGFRALAMTTLIERMNYRYEVVDRQLAHAPKNKMAAAYDRTKFLDERRTMMQAWADYLDAQSK